uniref:Uncharacterized protein n=1 Tax=Anguilla anguilla TaxID=7936 RepID=A0A0E9T4M3_ANGAN
MWCRGVDVGGDVVLFVLCRVKPLVGWWGGTMEINKG